MTFLSLRSGFVDPELNVVVKVEEQASEYHGIVPFSETLLILNVYLKGNKYVWYCGTNASCSLTN